MKRSTNHHLTAGRLRRFALATLLAALGAGLASAQDAKVFSIPAEPAAAAVEDLTRQSGLQVFAPAEDLQGVRTNAVQGTYTAMEAARRMLSGTGLEIVQTGENAITIRRPAAHGGQDLQEVVVTGTRIKRAGFDTLEAAIVTSSKQISRRGYTNVLEALQSTPGFGNPGSSSLSDQQGRLGIAQSFANFFSLGSQRTLTLVNGQRFVSSNTVAGAGSNASPGSQVDLNLIPVNLIDHIETIAIGGAPVYGADAIAGTVNIILKDHFQGLEATGQYGESGRGDAQSRMFSVLLGGNFAENRGNAVLSVDYTKQNPLR
ncbi:MAG TPA: TonB-dependent receptor, partial [Steroidobacteraceae bacterium]|nr:TonB-dependent receptor [Steroidobacteraceae bacterium]